MNFLTKIITQAVEHDIMVDNNSGVSYFSRMLSSWMLDECFDLKIGAPSNFYIPSSVFVDSYATHISGLNVILTDELELDGDAFKYFLSKYNKKWNNKYRLIIGAGSKNGILGMVRVL